MLTEILNAGRSDQPHQAAQFLYIDFRSDSFGMPFAVPPTPAPPPRPPPAPTPSTPAPLPSPPKPPPKSCEARCAAAGHCCTGTVSSWQHPSCAQGCIIAQHTKSAAACKQACKGADGKCDWSIDGVKMENCLDCPNGCSAEDGEAECEQGCALAFGV